MTNSQDITDLSFGEISAACGGEISRLVEEKVMARRAKIDAEMLEIKKGQLRIHKDIK